VNWSDEYSVEKSPRAKPVWACFAGRKKGPVVDMVGDISRRGGGEPQIFD